MAIQIGETAPSFSLQDQTGNVVSLESFRGKPLVLYFYPKDDTPGCTVESCTFRDQYQVFKDAGAEVVGISGDSPASHQQFASKYNLPFTLLSDPGDKVRKAFGATMLMGFVPGRITYVLDAQGIVRYQFDSMFNFKAHVEEALNALKQLA